MREFLFNLDLKQLLEKILQQILRLVEVVTLKLWVILEPYYHKALSNPAATGAILLALLGIPLIFIKVKKTNTKKEGRLDQVVEEMETFEGDTPLIDLQKNFQDAPFKDLEPFHEENSTGMDFEMDQATPEFDHLSEKLESDSIIELPSLLSNGGIRENKPSILSEERETADTELPAESVDNLTEMGDWNPESEPFSMQDSDWSQISPPTLSGYDDTEFYKDTDLPIEEIDGLQDMDESIQKMPHEISSEINPEDSTQEMKIDSVFLPTLESMEPPVQDESIEKTDTADGAGIFFQDADAPPEPKAPASRESEEDPEFSVDDEARPETHPETLKNNFEGRFPATVSDPETRVKETHLVQNFPLSPVRKSTGISDHTRPKYSGKDYEELLESLILLKGQKR